MAYQVRTFSFTIPARTQQAAPATLNTPLGEFIVSAIEWTVPPGPNGNVGFRFSSGGTPMIPANDGGWIVASGENASWPLTGQITSGAWQIQGYNTGLNDHTVHVRYLLDLVAAAAPPLDMPLLPAAAIMGELDGQTAGAGTDA